MGNFTAVPNYFENVTTLKGMLGVANATTGGYAYIGLLVMLQIIMLLALMVFGFETAILASAFVSLISGIFLAYLGLISNTWLMFFAAQIIIIILYITWQRRSWLSNLIVILNI